MKDFLRIHDSIFCVSSIIKIIKCEYTDEPEDIGYGVEVTYAIPGMPTQHFDIDSVRLLDEAHRDIVFELIVEKLNAR